MNAQQMLLDYAKSRNNHSTLTAEQFIGKAITEGVRIQDTANGGIVVVNIKREGKTITVIETTKEDVADGRKVTTVEVLQVNL